jgi:5'-nucleotidase
MRILLTNDDGVHADGLRALASVASSLAGRWGARVTVVAPAVEQSQCGHRVTTHHPLEVHELTGVMNESRDNSGCGNPARWFSVDGTPADCVRVALFGLGLQPDLVLSGVNHGGNMGQDLVISGTVAAAREAAYHGIPAMAFSHYLVRGLELDWARAGCWVSRLLEARPWEDLRGGEWWNINLPHLPQDSGSSMLAMPPLAPTTPARSPLPVVFAEEETTTGKARRFRYNGVYASRPRDPGSDVEACFSGAISMSRLGL